MEFVFVYLAGVVIGILGSLTYTYFFPSKGELTYGAEIVMGTIAWPVTLFFGLIIGLLLGLTYIFMQLGARIDTILLWVADKGRKQGH